MLLKKQVSSSGQRTLKLKTKPHATSFIHKEATVKILEIVSRLSVLAPVFLETIRDDISRKLKVSKFGEILCLENGKLSEKR